MSSLLRPPERDARERLSSAIGLARTPGVPSPTAESVYLGVLLWARARELTREVMERFPGKVFAEEQRAALAEELYQWRVASDYTDDAVVRALVLRAFHELANAMQLRYDRVLVHRDSAAVGSEEPDERTEATPAYTWLLRELDAPAPVSPAPTAALGAQFDTALALLRASAPLWSRGKTLLNRGALLWAYARAVAEGAFPEDAYTRAQNHFVTRINRWTRDADAAEADGQYHAVQVARVLARDAVTLITRGRSGRLDEHLLLLRSKTRLCAADVVRSDAAWLYTQIGGDAAIRFAESASLPPPVAVSAPEGAGDAPGAV